MRVFPRGVVLKHLAKACGRSAVRAALFVGLRQGQQQLDVDGGEIIAALRAPILVPILWKQLPPVCRERTFTAGDIPLPKRTLREALEVIHIDPDTLRV